MNWHLIEVTRARIIHLLAAGLASFAFVEHVIHVLLVDPFIGTSSVDLFFDLSLEIARVAAISMMVRRGGLSHVAPWAIARIEVLIAAVEGTIGTSEHLVAKFASNEGL